MKSLVLVLMLVGAVICKSDPLDAIAHSSHPNQYALPPSSIPTGRHAPSWNIALLFGTASCLSLAFSIFFFSISLGALTSLVVATNTTTDGRPVHIQQTPEIKFIRSIVAFFATMGAILFISVLILSALPPVYFGFGRPGWAFFYFLLVMLLIWGAMLWMCVFLYNKLHPHADTDINMWGCVCCGTKPVKKNKAKHGDKNSDSD